MKTKPMTHVVTVETDRNGRVNRCEYKARLTPNTVISEVGHRLPRDGTWRYGIVLARMIPDTLHPLTVDEQRAPLLQEAVQARNHLDECMRNVDNAEKELADAEKLLAKFDKRHCDKEDGA